MLFFLWILTLGLFIFSSLLCLYFLFHKRHSSRDLYTLWEGFKEGLRGCGLVISPHRYPVELYKWEITDHEHVCKDGLKRSTWPPMDIADWMKVGLPGTPEANTECGKNCSCLLVPCKNAHQPKNTLQT